MSTLTTNTDDTPLLEINTTPLIDVMLVLLIMLLLTLPMSTHRISMDMGIGPAAKREAVTIDIDFDGSLYWDGAVVENFARLESYFRSLAKEPQQPDVRINANRRARYEVVAQVLGAAQRNGIEHLGFIGQERFVE